FLAGQDAAGSTPAATNGQPSAPRSEVAPTPGQQERVQAALLEVIAEKTGYPPEMLDLDMALDADLGIDSIKRVEILSALQERLPEAPTVKPEHLGTLHTLRHIAAFLAGQETRSGFPAGPGLPVTETGSPIQGEGRPAAPPEKAAVAKEESGWKAGPTVSL